MGLKEERKLNCAGTGIIRGPTVPVARLPLGSQPPGWKQEQEQEQQSRVEFAG